MGRDDADDARRENRGQAKFERSRERNDCPADDGDGEASHFADPDRAGITEATEISPLVSDRDADGDHNGEEDGGHGHSAPVSEGPRDPEAHECDGRTG